MKKNYKNIQLSLHNYFILVSFKDDCLRLNLIPQQQSSTQFEASFTLVQFPRDLKLIFITIENIYWLFKDLSANRDKIPTTISFNKQNHHFEFMVKQSLAGIEINKKCHILMNQIKKKSQIDLRTQKKVDISDLNSQPKIISKESQKFNISQIYQKIGELIKRLELNEKDIQVLKSQKISEEISQKVKAMDKKQDFIINKIVNNEEKILKLYQQKKELQNIIDYTNDLLVSEIENVKGKIDQIRNQINSINTNKFSLHENQPIQQKDLTSFEIIESKQDSSAPIIYSRHSNYSNESYRKARYSSLQLTEQQLERIKQGGQNIETLNKKLKQLSKRFDIFIPPRQIELNFKQSPYINKYKTQDGQLKSFTLTKKPNDRKYQLVSQPFPQSGIFYFKLKLVHIPHGYIHIGIISGNIALNQSSYDNVESINYFGGNGSLNNKGNGSYIGKQLKNKDQILVIVDMSIEMVRFVLHERLICQARFEGLCRVKGIMAYIELYYGDSKIQIINY